MATVARVETDSSSAPAVSGPRGDSSREMLLRTLSTRPSSRSDDRIGHRRRDSERHQHRHQHVRVRPDHEDPGSEPGPEFHQEDRADTERAAEERRGEGADQRPGTDRRREHSDLELLSPWRLPATTTTSSVAGTRKFPIP